MMSWMNMNFQNPNSVNLINVNILHNMLMIMIINISCILIMMLKFNVKNKFNNKNMFNNQMMEILWTIIPIMLITIISIASINILFVNNEMKNNYLNIKIFSNQWFWSYEYPSLNKMFNSYMMMNNNFDMYIMETDNNLVIPFNYQILMIFSSMDVIHSWTIPSMNVKMDCIPNQINSMTIMTMKPSIMFGQCSEICGINHSFMPIKMESITMKNFYKWI